MLREDWSEVVESLEEGGYTLESPGLIFRGSNECLNGSFTMNVYDPAKDEGYGAPCVAVGVVQMVDSDDDFTGNP